MHKKNGLITGVLNKSSIAYAATRTLIEAGANVIVGCQTNQVKRVEEAVEGLGVAEIIPFDASIEGSTEKMAAEAGNLCIGGLDFILHSIAYAPPLVLQRGLLEMTLADYQLMGQISVYSLVEMLRGALPYMNQSCISIAMTFPPGSQRLTPGYNLGPSKSELEALVRYLNFELAQAGKGVLIAAGPSSMPTVAARSVPFSKKYSEAMALNAPQGALTMDHVADALSRLFDGMARYNGGTVHNIDNGGFELAAIPIAP